MSQLNEGNTMEDAPKKVYKSLINIPVRVEMSEVKHTSSNALTVDELAIQIEEAKKGKARVDSKYVGFELDERGHLFNYTLDYAQFLESMAYIIKSAKVRKSSKPNEVYKNSHEMRITNSPTSIKPKQ